RVMLQDIEFREPKLSRKKTIVLTLCNYLINGWRFNIKDHDMHLKSQNSGVLVTGDENADTHDPNWLVVVKTKPRDLYDMHEEAIHE
ncbi:unnamed protein product, partial [Sphenostylis stenocarpa]